MKRLRHWAIRLIIAIPLIIGSAWLIENYRGYQKWEEAQERADKLGVSLDLADYAAPTIPDSKNLLKNPDFAREWNGEIEPQLNRWTQMTLDVPKSRGVRHQRGEPMDYLQFFPEETDPKLAVERLSVATNNAESRLNKLTSIILSYPPQDLSHRQQSLLESSETSEEIIAVKKLVNSFRDQAVLALHRNEPDLAARNCEVIKRLAQNFEEPDLLHLLIVKAFHGTIRDISHEGLLLQRWQPEHLDKLSKILPTEVGRIQLADALSFEAAFVLLSIKDAEEIFETAQENMLEIFGGEPEGPPSIKEKFQRWIIYGGPKGWEQSRKAFALNVILDQIETATQWEWKQTESIPIDLDEPTEDSFSFDPLTIYRGLGRQYSNCIIAIFEHALRNRACLLAIEVEKHRLATGSYPSSIDELPQGLPIIDPCDPQKRPLHYELLPDGGFQIYSLFFYEEEPDPRRNEFIWKFPVES